MSRSLMPFHLAVPVYDLELCRRFYRDILGFSEGRSAATWVDFDFYGHQFVIHQHDATPAEPGPRSYSRVDGHSVPLPHFGVVLQWSDWEMLAARLRKHDVKFIVEPHIRFKGQAGEQATMFFVDPADNALEFKAFKNPANLFAK